MVSLGRKVVSASVYLAYLVVASSALLTLAGVTYELVQVEQLYGYLKGLGVYNQDLGILTQDAWLGWKPRDGAVDMLSLGGDRVHVDIDDGLLTYGEPAIGTERDVLLALGGSWTTMPLPRNYTQVAARLLDATPVVGGWGSYGLSHFVIMARKYVPSVKPDYLIVQYSQWSHRRAMQVFAPTFFGVLPNPYFYEDDAQELVLHPPVFLTNAYDLAFRHFAETERSLGDLPAFTLQVGLPYFVHNDLNRLFYLASARIGRYPEPATDELEVIRRTFAEISDLCEANEVQLVVLLFSHLQVERRVADAIRRVGKNIIVVDGVDALYSRLRPATRETFLRRYAWWKGDPPVLFDAHPNERAHRVVGEAVAAAIRKTTR
jgi:hypothetical protein